MPVQPASEAGPPAAAPPDSVSVVICAYTADRWESLCAAVDSVRTQTRPPHEIILVTDHADALLDRARTAFHGVRCMPNEGRQGLSDARNTGVRAATGSVVAFLDDDAVAGPGWVDALLAAHRDPRVVGVGGRVLPNWQNGRPRWFPDEFLWVVGCSYAGLPPGRAEIRNPIGASMSFRRDLFAVAGGFDPDMGRLGGNAAGCEETEFAIRARAATGGRILLEPFAVCTHLVPAQRSTRRYFRSRCRAEGRSKALVQQLVGAGPALEAERRYLRRVLPRAVVRGLAQSVTGDPAGGLRAWAIVEGAVLTAVSYLLARLRLRRATG